ncbi:MAG TPA: redoxin domain-containing protein [Gemmataceae bacterium]|nr:redoxin domain-containing protein [Gemmataceae bacterium]
MNTWWLVSYVSLWLVVVLLGFLLLGALRALGLLRWRLEQMEATTPSKVGRAGLKRGKKAPDFCLPCTAGGEVSLHDFAGRRVFLVFTQSGCKPCHRIVPELNKLQRGGTVGVLVVNNGTMEATRQWAEEVPAGFPVLVQQQFAISKRYETYATPFAFLINEHGVIASKGIVNNGQHIDFVLSGAGEAARNGQHEPEPAAAEVGAA